jgi:hypothetical protein
VVTGRPRRQRLADEQFFGFGGQNVSLLFTAG